MLRSRFLVVDNLQGGRMRWFLVSSNNRRLGQDVALSDNYSDCRTAALRVKQNRAELKPHLFASDRDGRWAWRVALDDVPLATACRTYLRVRECEYNLSRFLLALEEAEIVEGVRRVGDAGRPLSRSDR
ncbi:hypothetical protein HH310_08380 [Actinoplanes sp. TBRC 11911]|uniref:hypothetical protein n=1 Tax=Actinoplanes sp. TBRC 11911 TaxID=2729386 RepID=UPI00145DD8C0|nr:hypothetical protein [Actinoplanes sp. TBRC 11911]NMO51203.1 hypothetical protein [Actinoplanes sp. TBRC 11911]